MHPIGNPVQRRRRLGLRQRRGAAVHQRHVACAGERTAQSERADMAEHVQHARALRQGRHAVAVRPLIEVPAGLLPTHRIDREPHAAFHHFGGRIGAEQQRHALRQSLLAPRRGIIARHHGAQRQQSGERLDDQRRQPVHPGGVGLQHRDIVVAVDHQPGQAVGLGVHQAMKRRVAHALTQHDRLVQSLPQPVHVDVRCRIAIQQPRRDQAVRIEHEGAEPRAVVAFEAHQTARRHLPVSGFIAISLENTQGAPARSRRP